MLTINSNMPSGLRATLQCTDGHLLIVDDHRADTNPGALNDDWNTVKLKLSEFPSSVGAVQIQFEALGYVPTSHNGHQAIAPAPVHLDVDDEQAPEPTPVPEPVEEPLSDLSGAPHPEGLTPEIVAAMSDEVAVALWQSMDGTDDPIDPDEARRRLTASLNTAPQEGDGE